MWWYDWNVFALEEGWRREIMSAVSPARCHNTWWRHEMETFSALLALCMGNPSVTGEFPSESPVTRSFHVFLDLRLNKRSSKQSICRWFETPSCSLWRHCNEITMKCELCVWILRCTLLQIDFNFSVFAIWVRLRLFIYLFRNIREKSRWYI